MLIKSTLSSIPTYYMSLFNRPSQVIGMMERLQRDFPWNVADGAKKFQFVQWEFVTSPKQWGGLGVKDLKTFNKAHLGKWLWRFGMEGEALVKWKGGGEQKGLLCLLNVVCG